MDWLRRERVGRWRWMRSAAAAAMMTLALPSQAQPLDFGHGRLTPGVSPGAFGIRPVLVVLLEEVGTSFPADRNRDYFRRYFHALSDPSVGPTLRGFVNENSGGLCDLQDAGILGPLRARSSFAVNTGAGQNATANEGVELAADAGFDFARFDRNGDGVIQRDELTVVVVTSNPLNGVGNRGGNVVLPSGLRVRGPFALLRPTEWFTIAAHEFLHTFGAEEAYGDWSLSGINFGASLMGPSYPGPDGRISVHLDPWHKVELGWAAPRTIPIDGRSHCLYLSPATASPGLPDLDRDPVVLYDPNLGESRYFLVERRRRESYDGGALDDGVVVWLANVRKDGALAGMPWRIERRGPRNNNPPPEQPLASVWSLASDDMIQDADADGAPDFINRGRNDLLDTPVVAPDYLRLANALFVVPPQAAGVLSPQPGPLGWTGAGFWHPGNGVFQLFWPGAIDTGVRIALGPETRARQAVIITTDGSAPRRPASAAGKDAECYDEALWATPPDFAVLLSPSCVDRVTVPSASSPTGRAIAPGDTAFVSGRFVFAEEVPSVVDVALSISSAPAGVEITPSSAQIYPGERELGFDVLVGPPFGVGQLEVVAEFDWGKRHFRSTALLDVRSDEPITQEEALPSCAVEAKIRSVEPWVGIVPTVPGIFGDPDPLGPEPPPDPWPIFVPDGIPGF